MVKADIGITLIYFINACTSGSDSRLFICLTTHLLLAATYLLTGLTLYFFGFGRQAAIWAASLRDNAAADLP